MVIVKLRRDSIAARSAAPGLSGLKAARPPFNSPDPTASGTHRAKAPAVTAGLVASKCRPVTKSPASRQLL